ncbi:MAG: DMP19 family protein [Bacteroides sp.]|nr:DMP19 family protein [Bacteroides sp.]
MIQIKDSDLQAAALKGMDEFIQVFTDAYKEVIGEDFSAGKMHLLTGEQHTLLAYHIFREEVMEGGLCQLIQNGYGAYIFDNPFPKAVRLWGAAEFSKLLYKAKKIYDDHREDLERERTDEEFMAMYETYEVFDDLEEEYLEKEEEITALLAEYIDNHLTLFAEII